MSELSTWLDAHSWAEPALTLLGSVAVALLLDVLLRRTLPRWTQKTRTEVDDRILAVVRRPLAFSVILLGFGLVAFRAGLPEPWGRITIAGLRTVAILIWLVAGIRLAQVILDALSRNHERFVLVQPRTLPLLDNIATLLLLGGTVYLLLVTWDLDVSGWVTSAGILGLAVGLAAKDTLANLFAGMALLADAPFELGDYVVLDTGERGEVTRVGIRSSRIRTRDDIEIVLPNAVLADSKIVNEAGGPDPAHRVRLSVSVAYGTDLERAHELLMAAATEHERILTDPAPRVRVREFADSGIRMELMGWIPEPFLRGRVLDALFRRVYLDFNREGIEFPYPKRDVYLHRVDSPAPSGSDQGESTGQ